MAAKIIKRDNLRVTDPYVALLDAELGKARQAAIELHEQGYRVGSSQFGYINGLEKARNLYANPPRAGEK